MATVLYISQRENTSRNCIPISRFGSMLGSIEMHVHYLHILVFHQKEVLALKLFCCSCWWGCSEKNFYLPKVTILLCCAAAWFDSDLPTISSFFSSQVQFFSLFPLNVDPKKSPSMQLLNCGRPAIISHQQQLLLHTTPSIKLRCSTADKVKCRLD